MLMPPSSPHLREEGGLDQQRRQSHHDPLVEVLDGEEEDDVPDDDDDEGRDVRRRDVEGGQVSELHRYDLAAVVSLRVRVCLRNRER